MKIACVGWLCFKEKLFCKSNRKLDVYKKKVFKYQTTIFGNLFLTMIKNSNDEGWYSGMAAILQWILSFKFNLDRRSCNKH